MPLTSNFKVTVGPLLSVVFLRQNLVRRTYMKYSQIINYQNIKGFNQTGGILKIIKGLPWLPGLPWKHEKNAVTL